MKIFQPTNPDFYFLIVLSIVNAIVLSFMSYKFLQILQISNYKLKPYGIWLKDTKVKWIGRLAMLCFLSACCMLVTNVLFNNFQSNKILGYSGLVFYFLTSYLFIANMRKIPQKKPLVVTKRMLRLICIAFFLYLAITYFTLGLTLEFTSYIRATVISLTPLSIPIIAPLSLIISYPFEMIVNSIYKRRCVKKLEKMPNLIKIGITGSYGKTSTKTYLTKFLQRKYKVCTTPSSFNTPMGISRVVLNTLTEQDEVFVCEMGAVRKGEINELCKMVKPNYGIITAVGEQHLETFKNLETVMETKFELANNLKEEDFCVFNCGNKNTKMLYEKCELKNKINVCEEGGFLSAKNIVATERGLEFTIIYAEKEYAAKTEILGEHNIQNILSAAAIALNMGVSIDDIIAEINALEQVEHRLELKRLHDDILIIDDSFNSNIQGTAVALKTLKLFSGRRKIVVTPGLVELGKKEKVENIEFGKRIAKVANIVILVNKNQSENIKKGLLEGGFKEENIYLKDTLFEVTEFFKSLLKSGDIVLLENDLPDNYK